MRILVAGATGVLGRELVPRLVERGHDVAGMTRSEAKRDLVRGLGAQPAIRSTAIRRRRCARCSRRSGISRTR